MRILVTNDDGIYSPGIAALAKAAQAFGEVRIVAPDVEMSSAGHSITSSRPLSYKPTPIAGFDAYRVNGTPADCVALGTHNWEKIDVVLSGINLGSNVGNAIWHSGTIAAARQAALFGLRGIALSMPATQAEPVFDRLLPAVKEVLGVLMPSTAIELANVNFPERDPNGIRWTRQSVRHYDGEVVAGKDPMGRPHFWFVVKPLEPADEHTDRWAVEHGYISITPLRLDLTNERQFGEGPSTSRRHSAAGSANHADRCDRQAPQQRRRMRRRRRLCRQPCTFCDRLTVGASAGGALIPENSRNLHTRTDP
jgi:5'-nucleotidase